MSRHLIQKFIRLTLTFCVLAILPTCSLIYAATESPAKAAGTNDFVEYWGAARLLVTGGNPYSVEQLFRLQRSLGWPDDIPLLMWNPPWTLTFIIPFSFIDYTVSQGLWLLLHTGVILFCASRLWALYAGPPGLTRIAWVVTLTFLPTVFVLLRQQIGPLILLGTVGFLYFQKRQQWVLAGAMVGFWAIKPHAVYLLWLALLFWTLKHRCWGILIGVAGAALLTTSIPLLFNSSIFHQYLELHATAPPPTPFDWGTPTIGRAMRQFFVVEGIWLQLLPTLCGVTWFLAYWRRQHQTWNWLEQVPLLLLVSVATTFFGWVLDQIILLPALIRGAAWLARRQRPLLKTRSFYLYIAIIGLAIGVKFFSPYDFWYFWLSWAWLLNYLYLGREIASEPLQEVRNLAGRIKQEQA
jgi:hypothetical protein